MTPQELMALANITGTKVARRVFEKRGNHSEAHLNERELAGICALAAELTLKAAVLSPEEKEKLPSVLDERGPFQIGNVVITPADEPNPYTYRGPFCTGEVRKVALQMYLDNVGTARKNTVLWFAPAHGGARRITADEVDWEKSGLKVSP